VYLSPSYEKIAKKARVLQDFPFAPAKLGLLRKEKGLS
jgi:hypothetical protein